MLACDAEWDMLLQLRSIHSAERLVQPCVVTRRSGLAGSAIARLLEAVERPALSASGLENFSGVDLRQLQEQAG